MRNFFENGNSFMRKKIVNPNLDYEKWMKFILRRNKEVFELNKMKDIKKIFDPQNILNPGKVF